MSFLYKEKIENNLCSSLLTDKVKKSLYVIKITLNSSLKSDSKALELLLKEFIRNTGQYSFQ